MFDYPEKFSIEYAQDLLVKSKVCKDDTEALKLLREMQSAFAFNSVISSLTFDDEDGYTTYITFLIACDGDDGWVLHICTNDDHEPVEMRTYYPAQWLDLDYKGLYSYAQAMEDLAYEVDTNKE